MNVKTGLIFLTIVSVVADTMLLPFYPQFFSSEFNQYSPEHVGFYIAACSLTVMLTFPLWAKVAKKIHELHLWVYTQIAAGLLGISCYYAESLVSFWVLSQAMLIFKASYLLIYPFVMRLEEQDKHLGVASLFSILMHFGAIGGALLGGVMLEYIDPRGVYLIMAGSDALQVIVCLIIIAKLGVPFFQPNKKSDTEPSKSIASNQKSANSGNRARNYVYSLGIISLAFYLSAFLIRPFFSRHWETVSSTNNELMTAFIYSIPAWVALVGLWFNGRRKDAGNHYLTIFTSLFLGLIGVFLQSVDQSLVVILGRCIFGWALFQVTVRLEVVLFEHSHKDDYATDFSKIHLFQNIGVLIASLSVGSLVSFAGYQLPFWVSLVGIVVTILLFIGFFRSRLSMAPSTREETQTV